MNSFRSRLAAVMIVLIGLAVTASGIYMVISFERSHYAAMRDNLVREIGLIADAVEWVPPDQADAAKYYTERAHHYRSITGARVTFIGRDGEVLGDSDHDPRSMENHADRPEVIGALRDGIGHDIRQSDTVRQNMMYVAAMAGPDEGAGYIRLALGVSQIEESIRGLWFGLITGLLILFAVTAAVSWRIARSLTRPLEAVIRTAQRIRNMEYDARVPVVPRGEIGELGRAVNAMAESLQQQMMRIREKESQLESVLDNMINGIVMIDRTGSIRLLNRMAEELLGLPARELTGRHYTEARQQYELIRMIQEGLERREHLHDEMTFYYPEERLVEITLVPIFDKDEFAGVLLVLQDVSAIRRLERMRSEFVANVSHELKTPIAAVKGFAETLLGGAADDPETMRSFLQIIHDESDRLNRLVNDILELSQVESRRVPLQFSPVELEPFIRKTVELLAKEAARKNIRIDMSVGGGVYVEADEDRLRQIVMNVVSNAINYTPEGGRVQIRVEPVASGGAGMPRAVDAHAAAGASVPDDPASVSVGPDAADEYDAVRIWITDTGIGIPKKDLPRIFERFYRVDKARSRGSGGTGLGLSIVKHLVELHRGTISVESTVGAGTTFMIELPVLH